MLTFALWYVIVTLIGLVTFPLTYRLLPALADRGYAFARSLGLLVWGYLFWLLGSLGVLGNDAGGLTFAAVLLLALSLWVWRLVGGEEIWTWVRDHRRLVLFVEALFLVSFAAWAVVRAANPSLFGTEKPMELAFINAILRSPNLPPHDPWLSGYAISYYYFGYVLAAMLAQLAGVSAGVAFNLTIALVFALGALGAYGIVYNLLAWKENGASQDEGDPRDAGESGTAVAEKRVRIGRLVPALLGPVFVLLLGNLEGLLEVLHARGVFWRVDAAGNLTSGFWRWLDMQELSQPPTQPFSWYPRNFGTGSWWWWRASRVVQDYDLAGGWREVIDEFPFFSFLLADLHPHVLAIPFALLAVVLALNLYLGGASGRIRWSRFHLHLSPAAFLIGALVLGGLAFLNTWDFPMYLALFAGAYVLFRARQAGWGWDRLWDFLGISVAVGAGGVVLYLPFYVGFSSQAGGIIPNLVYVTRGAHLWVMFGLFFIVLFPYLVYLWRAEGNGRRLGRGVAAAAALLVALLAFDLLLGLGAVNLPGIGDIFLDSLGARGLESQLFQEALTRRISQPGAWLTLFVLIGFAVGVLWPRGDLQEDESTEMTRVRVQPFVVLMILLAALLVLAPEFVYLRDQFGWRINTIFKFYYQAWILWGVAGAYAAIILVSRLKRAPRVLFQASLVLALAAGLVYPFFGLWDKTSGFNPPEGWTLDGVVRSPYLGPEDAAAVAWLKTAPYGILAEAVGGSYSQYGRVSAASGLPAVLGWPGHESQWRGGGEEMGTRMEDIERLYATRIWEEAEEVLRRYRIRYVYVGPLERSSYGVYEPKFERFLTPVYQEGQVTIYQVPAGLEG